MASQYLKLCPQVSISKHLWQNWKNPYVKGLKNILLPRCTKTQGFCFKKGRWWGKKRKRRLLFLNSCPMENRRRISFCLYISYIQTLWWCQPIPHKTTTRSLCGSNIRKGGRPTSCFFKTTSTCQVNQQHADNLNVFIVMQWVNCASQTPRSQPTNQQNQ